MSSSTHYMEIALRLARRGLGQVAPRCAEGCVIVAREPSSHEDFIVARGWADHTERAVARAVKNLNVKHSPKITLDVYLTGDPSESDTALLIELRPKCVVIACRTAEQKGGDRQIKKLTKAGAQITVGFCSASAARVHEAYFIRVRHKRPQFTLKLATTLDGCIATHDGESKWITSAQSRALVQRLRYDADAIMVGSATALLDDPQLVPHLPGLSKSSTLRVIADGRLRLPLTSKLVQTSRDVPTMLLTREDGDPARIDAYRDCGVEIVTVALDRDNQLDLTDAAEKLAERGLTRVLVEGGARLAASLLTLGFVDRLVWFHAPKVMGADGLNAIAELGLSDLSKLETFEHEAHFELGDDTVQFLRAQK